MLKLNQGELVVQYICCLHAVKNIMNLFPITQINLYFSSSFGYCKSSCYVCLHFSNGSVGRYIVSGCFISKLSSWMCNKSVIQLNSNGAYEERLNVPLMSAMGPTRSCVWYSIYIDIYTYINSSLSIANKWKLFVVKSDM